MYLNALGMYLNALDVEGGPSKQAWRHSLVCVKGFVLREHVEPPGHFYDTLDFVLKPVVCPCVFSFEGRHRSPLARANRVRGRRP
jgi:hypothetical protein